MSGDEKCDMKPIKDEGSPYNNVTPLPRHLNQQLDALVEKHMSMLEVTLLKDLQQFALGGYLKMKDWDNSKAFLIYLCIFVYLSGLERDTWGLYAWKTELERQNKRVRPVSYNYYDDHHVRLLTESQPTEECVPFTWPLEDKPDFYIEKNTITARNLSNYCKCLFKGEVPYAKENARSTGGRKALKNSSPLEGNVFAEFVKRVKDLLNNIRTSSICGFGGLLTSGSVAGECKEVAV